MATVARGTGRHAREGEVLMLKTVNQDGTAYNKFRWPADGRVEAPDWNPDPKCGNGLHGLVRGCGDGSLLSTTPESIWIVFAAREMVEFEGKGKAPAGRIVHYGDRERAIEILCEEYPDAPIVYRTATAGYEGTATAGRGGTATAGERGTATAGRGGTATAGDGGTATAGDGGTATAGDDGVIQIKWWDNRHARWRMATGYIGENGLEPNVKYRLNDNHQFARAAAKENL